MTIADAEQATSAALRPDPNASGRHGPDCTYLPADADSLVLVKVNLRAPPATSTTPSTEPGGQVEPVDNLGDSAVQVDGPTGGATIATQGDTMIAVTVTGPDGTDHDPAAEQVLLELALSRL